MTFVPLDRLICFALYSAGQAMQQTYKPLLEPLGLTYPQFLLLNVLWEGDNRTVGDLCAAMGLKTNTVTPMLKRLEAAGLVGRTRDRADERRVHVHLTDRGHALRERTSDVAGCIAAATGMPIPDLVRLTGQLQGLTAQLRSSLEQAQRAASATTGSASSHNA